MTEAEREKMLRLIRDVTKLTEEEDKIDPFS